MANPNNSNKRPGRPQGVPKTLAILLMVIALVVGGIAGFAIARATDPARAQLQKANARITELENTMTLSGFSLDGTQWGEGDLPVSDDEGLDLSDVWGDAGIMSNTLDETADPVVVAEYDGGTLLSTDVIPVYNDELTTQLLNGADAETISGELMDLVLKYMVAEKLIAQKATEMGLDVLTDEDKQQIRQKAEAEYADQVEFFAAFVMQDGMTQDEVKAAAAEEYGISVDTIAADIEASWPLEKFYNETVKDVTVSDDDVKAHYDHVLAEQKELYEGDREEFEYAHMQGETILYNLPGYRAVKNLLITFESDEDAEKAAELLDQYEQLDPMADQDKLQALQAELDPLYAPLEKKAEEIVKQYQDGKSYDELLMTYGMDEFMRMEPMGAQGYYIGDESYLFSREFIEGSMMLEQPGQVSAPLRSAEGVHLTLYLADVPEGEVPLDSVREEIRTGALEEKQAACYDAAVDALLQSANVKYYPERLQ